MVLLITRYLQANNIKPDINEDSVNEDSVNEQRR